MWAMSNFVADCDELRNQVLRMNIVDTLNNIYLNFQESIKQ